MSIVLLCAVLLGSPPSSPRFSVELQASFEVPAAELFTYLHRPSRIRWLGPFRLVRTGTDPAAPSGLGSVRRVTIFVPTVEETITRFEPPHELHYAVTYSKAFENHCGQMRVSSVAPGRSHLVWVVRFDSKKRNPERHHRFTRRYLQRALRCLQRRVRRRSRHLERAGAKAASSRHASDLA